MLGVTGRSPALMSLAGNTLGALASLISGTILLCGGNNLTLSQEGNTVTIVGPAIAAQSAESNTFGMSDLGNTAGTSGVISAAQVRLLLAGGNNVTLSQSINGATATVSVVGPSLTPYQQASEMSLYQAVSDNSLSLGTGATQSFRHTSADGQLQFTSAMADYMATGERGNYFFTSNKSFANETHIHGNLALTNVTGTSASDGLSLAVAAQSVQPVAVSGSNGSYLFSTLQLVTGNGASFYTDATGIRLIYTVPSQTVQPVAASGSNGSFLFSTLQFVTGNGASFYTDATGTLFPDVHEHKDRGLWAGL